MPRKPAKEKAKSPTFKVTALSIEERKYFDSVNGISAVMKSIDGLTAHSPEARERIEKIVSATIATMTAERALEKMDGVDWLDEFQLDEIRSDMRTAWLGLRIACELALEEKPRGFETKSLEAIFKLIGSKGGTKTADHWHEVEAFAVDLARKTTPSGGWDSAAKAATAVLSDVEAFARRKGRGLLGDSERQIAIWLRKAGIKKAGATS